MATLSMIPRMGRRVGAMRAAALALVWAALPVQAQELPPEIQADRFLLEADRQIGNGDFGAALAALDRILALQADHDLEIPAVFWSRRAQVLLETGQFAYAIAAATRYLQLTGREGEDYRAALEVLNEAERWLAEGRVRDFNPTEGRICTEVYSPESCWMELADRLGCYLWNPSPRENVTVTWSSGCSNGLAQGDGQVDWFQNDELIQTWRTRLQGGRADGPFFQRSGDGRLEAQGRHVNGEASGHWRLFYEDHDNDLVREEGPYVDGERHGTWTESYEDRDDGLVRAVGPWVDGEYHGTWVLHYANGNQGGGPYVNGERHGIWTFFYEGRDDNVVRSMGPYVNGEEHGIWTGYDASGIVVGTLRYENGREVGVTLPSDGTLEVSGRTSSGSLSSSDARWHDGSYYDRWTFDARAGQRLVVTMDSDDVDAYLRVIGRDDTTLASDDDSGSGTNARIEFEAPYSGQYSVIASSYGYGSGDTGSYRVRVGTR